MKYEVNIYEPDKNLVHAPTHPGQDAVTLCNHTDWIGETEGEDTSKPIDCRECLSLIRFVQSRKFRLK